MKRIAFSAPWLSRHAVIIVLGVAVAAAGTLTLIAHKAHLSRLSPLLPYAAILLCPLMHVFRHGGHGGHGAHGGQGSQPPGDDTKDAQ